MVDADITQDRVSRLRGTLEPQDAFAWAASVIAAALKNGLPPQAVLVLVEDYRDVEALRSVIADRVVSANVRVLSHADPVRNAIAISPLISEMIFEHARLRDWVRF